ncbi:MAG: hypothetical protein KDC98_16450 [Planctomycetes bacterium]|nr:hypothetical protein [Planctomycetota bacterium]
MAQQTASPDDARRVYADHDYTTTPNATTFHGESFADIKVTGDPLSSFGRSYVVGTIEVETTDPSSSPTFSGFAVGLPTTGWPPFSNSLHQVGLLQCRDSSQAILWQRFFYGWNATNAPRWTNLRAVAVWPDEVEAEARVVICGETFDEQVPLAQNLPSATVGDPTGFLAVFDGSGLLLWTQRFYGQNFNRRCAITDVAIRVEHDGNDTYDVVTYCGVSTHGNPGSGTPLTPVNWFPAPTAPGTGYVGAAGNTNAGAGAWDGIVGRVRFNRAGSTTSTDFHSIVGGSVGDGLFGLALLDEDRFVAVGNTTFDPAHFPGVYEAYPFTQPGLDNTPQLTWDWNNQFGAHPYYCVGTVMLFDAAPTRLNGDLVLEESVALGHMGPELTIARDVWAAPAGPATGDVDSSIFVVGSTTDNSENNGDLLDSIDGGLQRGAQPYYGGGLVDGFLVHAITDTQLVLDFTLGTFYGGLLEDGLTGVSGWPGMPFDCAVTGFTEIETGNIDLVAASYHEITGLLARQDIVGSNLPDLPSSAAPRNAMLATSNFAYLPALGGPNGGGIGVDALMRATIIGATPTWATSTFPVWGGGDVPMDGLDAVRVVYDLLPEGVWRTDGTGTRAAAFGSVPQPSGYYGGTTPSACLDTFGRLPGEPAPELQRIWIDYQGPHPTVGVNNASIRLSGVSLDPNQYTLGVIQYGFPATPWPPGATVEVWAYQNPTVLCQGYGCSLIWPLSPLPGGPSEFTLQGVFLLQSPLNCDPNATIASPGLIISY